MPKYRALEKGYVDGKFIYPGEIFDSEVNHGLWMELVDSDPGMVEVKAESKPTKTKAKPEKSKPVKLDGLTG